MTNDKTPEKLVIPFLPEQGEGLKFAIDEDGRLITVPGQALSEDTNDYSRLRPLQQDVLDEAKTALNCLKKSNFRYDSLETRFDRYIDILDGPIEAINFEVLYNRGIALESEFDDIKAQGEAGDIPPPPADAVRAVNIV